MSEHDDLNIPPKLAADLADLHRRRIFVPPDVDQVIHNAAARRLRWRSGFRGWAVPVGAAAAAAIAAILWLGEASDSHDIDRSGRVDILDAFALARSMQRGADVTQADIDAVAQRAVKLPEDRG